MRKDSLNMVSRGISILLLMLSAGALLSCNEDTFTRDDIAFSSAPLPFKYSPELQVTSSKKAVFSPKTGYNSSINCYIACLNLQEDDYQILFGSALDNSHYHVADNAELEVGSLTNATLDSTPSTFYISIEQQGDYVFKACDTNDGNGINISASTDCSAPYLTNLYVRGDFNNWTLQHPLEYSDGVYSTLVFLESREQEEKSYYEFKVADDVWTLDSTYSIKESASGFILLDVERQLEIAQTITSNTKLDVLKTGTYLFELSVKDSVTSLYLKITYFSEENLTEDLTQENEDNPLKDIFLRGSFNEWEAQEGYKFTHMGDAVYQLDVTLVAQDELYEFKIADAIWSGFSFSMFEDNVGVAEIGTSFTMIPAAGTNNNSLLKIEESGPYRFVIQYSESENNLTVLIEQIE